jgi:hypothetical protein
VFFTLDNDLSLSKKSLPYDSMVLVDFIKIVIEFICGTIITGLAVHNIRQTERKIVFRAFSVCSIISFLLKAIICTLGILTSLHASKDFFMIYRMVNVSN